jgi:peptidoglycan/LPS O-acetylase OafA/YrhL
MGGELGESEMMGEATGSDEHGHGGMISSAPPSRSFGQVRAFDGLRGVAVLIVYIAHTDVILPIPNFLVIPGATVSLDSFFVLSGFLITALLLKEQARRGYIGIAAFYRRRALRLLPALYVVVIANALFAYFSHQWLPTELPSILSVVFYYANYYSASALSPLSPKLASGYQHLWSLSFEEQFYLVWPWITIVILTVRTRLRTVVIVLLSLIVLIGIHRIFLYNDSGRAWWQVFYRTDTRADSILWGALLAHIWIRRKEPKRGLQVAAWVASAFLLVCLPLAREQGPFIFWGGWDAIDFACAVVILALLDGRWPGRRLFELKPFVALGKVSYGFYLWHIPVFFAVRHFDSHWNNVERVIIATVVTLIFTLLSWFALERPLMAWNRRLEARRDVTDITLSKRRPPGVVGGESPTATDEDAEQRANRQARAKSRRQLAPSEEDQ